MKSLGIQKPIISIIAISTGSLLLFGCGKADNAHQSPEKSASNESPAIENAATTITAAIDPEAARKVKLETRARGYLTQLYPGLAKLAMSTKSAVVPLSSFDYSGQNVTNYDEKPFSGFGLETSGWSLDSTDEETPLSTVASIREFKNGYPSGWSLSPKQNIFFVAESNRQSTSIGAKDDDKAYIAEYDFKTIELSNKYSGKPHWRSINKNDFDLTYLGFYSPDHKWENSDLSKAANTFITNKTYPKTHSNPDEFVSINYTERNEKNEDIYVVEATLGQSVEITGDRSADGTKSSILAEWGEYDGLKRITYLIKINITELSTKTSIKPFSGNDPSYLEVSIFMDGKDSCVLKYNASEGSSDKPIEISLSYNLDTGAFIAHGDDLFDRPDGISDEAYEKFCQQNKDFCILVIKLANEAIDRNKDMILKIVKESAIPAKFTIPATESKYLF